MKLISFLKVAGTKKKETAIEENENIFTYIYNIYIHTDIYIYKRE